MNRPGARNALSMALMTALEEALEAIARDDAVKVVVIAGAGPAFCAGHDLREVRGADGATHERLFAQCSRLMQAITALRMPVIARVHGVATAAGCQLVATCDLAIAADTARFATPGVNIGLFCSTPMVALSRAVGRKAAMEMLLTGELIPAGAGGAARADQPGGAGSGAGRRGLGAGPADREQEPRGRGARQAGLLPAGRDAARRRLCLHGRRHGAEHAGARCRRGDRRVPGEAPAGLGVSFTRAALPRPCRVCRPFPA